MVRPSSVGRRGASSGGSGGISAAPNAKAEVFRKSRRENFILVRSYQRSSGLRRRPMDGLMARRVAWLVLIFSLVALGPTPPIARAADPTFDFSTWHYPVPAGEWLISR